LAGPAGSRLHGLAARVKMLLLRSICIFISITLPGANLKQLAAEQVTTVAPPSAADGTASSQSASNPSAPGAADLPDAPVYPDAVPIPPPGSPVSLSSATQTRTALGIDIMDGAAVITYGDRTVQADHIEYNPDTSQATLTGHVVATESDSDEHIEASHGTVDVRTLTGTFYDVTGSVGLKQKTAPRGQAGVTSRAVYANGNPFLFTGKMVVRTGPRQFQVFDGTITSCQLPRPDWVLSGAEFKVDGQKAYAYNSLFRLVGLPVLWLPYVTHPTNASDRQSGIYIPDIGFNSAAYGTTIGEQVFWAINRSTDLTGGIIYYSARGYEEKGGFRYRGLGQDMVKSYFSSLQDRGYTPPGGTYINQSGTDVTFSGRHDLIPAEEQADAGTGPGAAQSSTQLAPVQERAVANVEYLSSFSYRESFSPNFNQAVSTDVISTVFLTREFDGMAGSLEGDRYQGEKRVQTTNASTGVVTPEEQVHIIHAPALEFTTTDHMLGNTGLEWNFDSSATALKRAQPYLTTSGMIERLDVRPELAYPLGFAGWHMRPSIAGRETFYSRSRFAQAVSPGPGLPNVPVENAATLNRADLDLEFDVRAPVLERTFDSGLLRNLFRHDFRHTIEPELVYRYVTGINNFQDILRFDDVDIASDTNELEYGLTQRLFLRRNGNRPCRSASDIADVDDIFAATAENNEPSTEPGLAAGRSEDAPRVCGSREWISWHVAQKYFFNTNFGGAVTAGPRNILETTLDFSGISFMTRPRDISPLISRLRVRPSDKVDLEWDFDYDTCASPSGAVTAQTGCTRKFTANNVYLDVHQGFLNSGVTFARLDAPARSYVNGSLSSIADYQQMRVHFGFRNPSQIGFSAAATAGVDIDLGSVQYGSVVAAYNWNCCGLTVEYRKQQLGTTPPKDGYGFNFTLANIGSAGSVKHSDQIF
jgi:LPS-assembly protein